MRGVSHIGPERPRDPRSRAIVRATPGPGGIVSLDLECGHSVRRSFGLCRPDRVICPSCPEVGGLGNHSFPHLGGADE